jgi:hypothetical protein
MIELTFLATPGRFIDNSESIVTKEISFKAPQMNDTKLDL